MRRWTEVAIRAGKAFAADKCSLYAAGITYYTLVALFPLVLFALSVAGFLYTDAADRQELIDTILEQVPLQGSGEQDLRNIIDSVVSARGTLGVLGLIGAAWTGSSLFTAVRNSLNVVFEVEKPRNFALGKAIDLAWVIGVGALLILSVAATFLLTFLQRFATDLVGEDLATPVRLLLGLANLLLPTLISFGIFFVLYAFVANSPIPWRHVMPGALLAAIGFEILKVGFSWYVAAFGNYNATYGTLGFIIALLFFIYLGSQLMLFGAEFGLANHRVLEGEPATEEYASEVDHLRALVSRLKGRIPGMKADTATTSTAPARAPATAAAYPAMAAVQPAGAWKETDMATEKPTPDDRGASRPDTRHVGRLAEAPGGAFGNPEEVQPRYGSGPLPLPDGHQHPNADAMQPSAGAGGSGGTGRFALGAGIVAAWVAIMAVAGLVLARSHD